MRTCHRWIRAAIVLTLTVATFFTSGALGSVPLGMAAPRNVPPSPGGNDQGRFTPQINAPKLPVSAWHAPASAHGPALKSVAAGSGAVANPAQGRTPGEQVDLRTENTKTFLNADGTWTLKTYSVPVHYKDVQGHWQDIDNTVVADTSDAGYAYGNKASFWHVHFADTAGGPHLMHLQSPGVTLAETLDAAASVPAAINGRQIVYARVFPGVDLLYGLGNAHLEETLLLHSAQVPASYTFTEHVPSAKAQQDAAGNIIFTDAHTGHFLFAIGGVEMVEADAHGRMLPTGAGTQAVTVALSGSGPDFTITLTPDHAWLADPARHFPVAIDPTIGPLSHATTTDNTSSGETYSDTLDESANPTWSFYNNPNERIGNCNAIPPNASGYNTGTNRSYIKFPLGTLPTRSHVTYGNLSLYQVSAFGGSTGITANAILTSWNATTLTWNTHPTSFSYAGSGTASTNYNLWITVDVTAAANGWIEAGVPNNGLEIQYTNESVACDSFASDDYGVNFPSLQIGYSVDSTAPSGTVALNGTYNDGAGHLYTNNPTVSMATSTPDPDGTSVWGSNWTTVNGVGTVGYTGASWSVDSAGSQLTASTASCGGSQCWAETFFTNTVSNMSAWPFFTAMFKTDAVQNLHFGVISGGNSNTRCTLASTSSTGFNILETSHAAGSWGSSGVNVPISPNTWYYGQVEFPYTTVCEIRVWAVGQPRPSAATIYATNIYMDNPGLNFWLYGDNGANLHHYYVGNVNVATGGPAWGMQFSNDNSTWSCPAPASGTWCVAAARQTGWSLASGGDGLKTVYLRAIDNAGNVSSTSASSQIILDTAAPTASMTAPAAGREVRGQVVVTGTASDPGTVGVNSSGLASVSLYMDGQATGTGLGSTSNPTFLWDTTNLTPGAHVLTMQATDHAGNVGAMSAGVTVIVSNTGQMPYETFATRDLPADSHSGGANVGNGNAVVTHQDLDVPGRGPDLAIGRSYNALAPICSGLFGCGWTSDLDEGLMANGDGSVTYRDPDGGIHVFLPNGSGGYLTSPGLYLTLAKNGDGTYTITAHDQTKTNFNAGGYLTSVVDRNGNTLTVAYNGSLMPTTVTDAAGRQLTITTSGGHITSIAAPGSRTYGYAYDGNGNLTDYTDPASIVTHYTYDTSHRLTKVTLNYQASGPTDQQTNVATTLTYDTNNRLVSIVDPLGYDADLSYTAPTATAGGQTAVNQLKTNASTTPSSTNSVYETSTYFLTTDAVAAVAQIIDPINQGTGHATQYQYDGNADVTQVTDPDGHVSTSTYDASGNELTHVVDPGSAPHLNLTTTSTYDSANNVLTDTDPRGIVTQYTYDAPATGNLTKVVHDYVANGPTDSQTNVTTTYTYDSHGEALTTTDPLGFVTQYTYDSQGDVTQTVQNYKQGVNPDSQTNVTTSATYDALGQKLTTTNALGVVTQTTYDIRGNVMQTVANYKQGVNPDSQTNVTTNYGYDALGRQVTVTNPRNIVTQTTYDADGRVVKSVQNYVSGGGSDSQTNVTTTTAYDAAGNATLGTDPKGNTTTTKFDADNRSTEVVVTSSPASGSHQISDTKTTYDAAGLKLSSQVMDGNTNPTTSYTYDAAGRLATQSDPPAKPGATDQSGQPNVTTTTYDADGNATETKVTNAVAGTVSDTTAVFDKVNHQTSKTEQNGTSAAQTTSYVYDQDGRQTSLTDPANKATTTSYDALGRTLTVASPDGSQQAMTYDAAGQRLTQSNCGGTTGRTGTSIDTYDPLGRAASEQRQDCTGAVQTTVTYTYDADGNKLSQTTSYAGGTQFATNYTYDNLDRLATTSDGTVSKTYDANSNVTQSQALSGSSAVVTATLGYDGGSRLSSLTDNVGPAPGTQLHSYSYSYDGNGNRTTVVADGVTTTYAYDGDNQLTSITSGGTTTTYAYDANHNRTSMAVGSATTTYAYDSADVALTSKTDPSGKVTTYTYDANGNLTKAIYDPTGANQQTTYTYDTTNRLTSVALPSGTTVTLTYDGDGNRVAKSVTSGGTTTTTKDVYQLGHLAYQTDGSGTLLASFTYDEGGAPVSVQVGSNPTTAPRYYYVYNGHGDVVNLTDASGNSVATYAYDAFGVPTTNTENFPGGWSNPYRYDGRDGVRYDGETGLYWLSVRAYDPTLGRFISHDPLNRAPLMGWSDQPYAYAGNNPLTNVDPSGQRFATENAAQERVARSYARRAARVQATRGARLWRWWSKASGLLEARLRQLKGDAGRSLFIGGLIQVAALVVDFLANNRTIEKLELFLSIFLVFTTAILPGLGQWIANANHQLYWVYRLAHYIAGGLNIVAGVATMVLGVLKFGGWLMQLGVDAGVNAVQTAAEGIPGLVERLALSMLGKAAALVMTGFALQFFGYYNVLTAEEDREEHMTLREWCREIAQGACGPMPSN